jgi:hypothetical protein
MLLFLSLGAPSQAANFPLQTGNVWVYKQTSGVIPMSMRTIEVGRPVTFDDHEYYVVNYFGRTLWLREAEDEKFFSYDVDAKTESLWLDLNAKGSFRTSMECAKSGTVDPKGTHYKGPFGEFSNVITVVYDPSCADAGPVTDVFLPHIGLIQHSEQSIGGPIVFDLVYSHTGLTEVADSQVSFSLALDSTTYPVLTKQAIARMMLRNGTAQPLKLVFPSGQDFDVIIRNDKGEAVFKWSEGRGFTQAIRTVELAPGESKTFVVLVPLEKLQQGRYIAEANLATTNPREYTASVTFEIASK